MGAFGALRNWIVTCNATLLEARVPRTGREGLPAEAPWGEGTGEIWEYGSKRISSKGQRIRQEPTSKRRATLLRNA
jgi:hypothetical protein